MQRRSVFTIVTHLLALAVGFALGIYALPILTAPPSPAADGLQKIASQALYHGEFRRDLADSDFLHWGEGRVSLSNGSISLEGELAPGPDYRLYLSPEFVETEDLFEELKIQMVEVGDVKTFRNFFVTIDSSIELEKYNTVIVWCESFGEFITSARYR